MTTYHAVVWIDHHSAQILQFDEAHVQAQKVKAHSHHTKQHGSSVRTGHEFFGEVCDALAGITEPEAKRKAIGEVYRQCYSIYQSMDGVYIRSIDKGEADAKMMNTVCFDAFGYGNHEFDDGDGVLKNFLDQLYTADCQTPIISANVVPEAGSPLAPSGIPVHKPYLVKTYDGVKVGIIGIGRIQRGTIRTNQQVSVVARDGKVRALAVASRERIPQLPDVPTLAELDFSVCATLATTPVSPPSRSAASCTRDGTWRYGRSGRAERV